MAEIKDLEICDYFFPLKCNDLLAVGWLGPGSDYTKDTVDEGFFSKLCELLKDPWQPILNAGCHTCEFCQFDGFTGFHNVFIPYQGKISVAPEMIRHYIAAHYYKPPDIFIEAVLNCPQMKSMEYKISLLENGGRNLIQHIS